MRRFEEIEAVVEVLVTQWARLGDEQKKWSTGNTKKSREHLSTFCIAIKNLHYLQGFAQKSELPPSTPPFARSTAMSFGLERRHVAIACPEGRPPVVYEAHHAPGITNLLRGVIVRPDDKPVRSPAVMLHHVKGKPCHVDWCLIPLRTLFHPESRLVALANWIAAKTDRLIRYWDMAYVDCGINQHLAEMRRGKIGCLSLISMHDPDEDEETSMFLLHPAWAKRLFPSEKLLPMTDELRSLLHRYAVVFPPQEVVCLVRDAAGEDPEEAGDRWEA